MKPNDAFHSEREQTDESLQLERERADLAIEEQLAEIDSAADEVIARARARAAEIVAAARTKHAESRERESGERAAKRQERARALEDLRLREDREDADELVRRAREEQLAILQLEREETDRDIERERARADAAVATRDEFLAVVSHDLRGLLHTIVLQAGLIHHGLEQKDHEESVRNLAKRIQVVSGRMNRLIGDLMDVASIEAGALAVAAELTDPAEVLAEAAGIFEANAKSRGIGFGVEIASPLPPTKLDAARILQVLGNLLENALKFTQAGGQVRLHAERVDSDLHVAVEDTGAGIPHDRLESVFERFVQAGQDDRRGVGLGLYISKCIVIGHGGRIWAESELGHGSTVHFTLPLTT